jgi:acyl carrier protein
MHIIAYDPTLDKVVSELEAVFRGKGLTAPPLSPLTVLDSSLGLESLDFAELVVRLEEIFGKDPFAQVELPQVSTIADLSRLYEPQAGA